MNIFNCKKSFIVSLIKVFALVPLCLCACSSIVHSEKTQIHYMSIEELYRSCLPDECGKKVILEGKEVQVRGSIDRNNVFDRKAYPQLPYEKFKIYDKKSGKAVEVWAVANDNRLIFKKIKQNADIPGREVFISGVVSSFDMPIMGKCKRGIKIEIKDEEKILFK